MKQRLMVARALVNRPRVLFLDEPTRGLDPTSAREIRAIVARLASENVTIVLTTHYMEEADELCTRVAFLSQGKIVALDTPRELKLRPGSGRRRCSSAIRAKSACDSMILPTPSSSRAGCATVTWRRSTRRRNLEDVFIALAGRPL